MPGSTQRKPPPHGPLYYWLPALAWLSMQAMFSTGVFTSDHTVRVLAAVLQLLDIHPSAARMELMNHIIRKCAHFTTYGILSWLVFRGARGNSPESPRKHLKWALIALGITLLAASSDEIHQIFVAGRTPTWHDVVLDMTGATFAQLLIHWRERKSQRLQRQPAG